jgi:hypothetical protein
MERGEVQEVFTRKRTLNRRKRSTFNVQRSMSNRQWGRFMEREEVQPVDAQEDHEPLANLKSQISNLNGSWRGGRCKALHALDDPEPHTSGAA